MKNHKRQIEREELLEIKSRDDNVFILFHFSSFIVFDLVFINKRNKSPKIIKRAPKSVKSLAGDETIRHAYIRAYPKNTIATVH